MNKKRKEFLTILYYTLLGVFCGIYFPVGAYIYEIIKQGGTFSWRGIIELHQNNSILYMIDTAPLFLGIVVFLAGISKAKSETNATRLEKILSGWEKVIERSRKVFPVITDNSDKIGKSIFEMGDRNEELGKLAAESSSDSNEMTESINRIDLNIQQVSEVVEKSFATAMTSKQTISLSTFDMNNVGRGVAKTLDIMNQLETDMEQIREVTKQITEIAEKTNLLALNASIESARAGVHGHGFKVVADEVKKLSDNTKNSIYSIGQIIEEIQKGSREAFDSINDVNAVVERGKETNKKVVSDIDEIIDKLIVFRESFASIAKETKGQVGKTGNIAKSSQQVLQASDVMREYLAKSASLVEDNMTVKNEIEEIIYQLKLLEE